LLHINSPSANRQEVRILKGGKEKGNRVCPLGIERIFGLERRCRECRDWLGLRQDVALALPDVPGIAVITICGFLRVLRLPWIFLSYAVDIFVEQE